MRIEMIHRAYLLQTSLALAAPFVVTCQASRSGPDGPDAQLDSQADAGDPDADDLVVDGAVDAQGAVAVADAAVAAADAVADAAGADVSVSDVATPLEAGAVSKMSAASRGFLRLANWTPDAPSPGFDVCLAPHGTQMWGEPLLTQSFPRGTLGQGGANGIQFPWLTTSMPVAPGDYDLQVIVSGSTSCTTGETPSPIVLPGLVAGGHWLIATIGDLNPTDNDASFKVAVFPDALPTPAQQVALRVINTLPSVAYVDVGTGSAAANNFSPLLTDVAFGTSGISLADGGMIGAGQYDLLAPIENAQFSARASGIVQDAATASHVSLAAGSVTTMALVNGKNGGVPPQFLICTDSAAPVSGLTPCMVYAQ